MFFNPEILEEINKFASNIRFDVQKCRYVVFLKNPALPSSAARSEFLNAGERISTKHASTTPRHEAKLGFFESIFFALIIDRMVLTAWGP